MCTRNRDDAKLKAMTNGRFEILADLEFEYKGDERIFWVHPGNLAQNLAKFVCESTNVRCAKRNMPAQEDVQSANSVELSEAEVREFLEKVFRGEE